MEDDGGWLEDGEWTDDDGGWLEDDEDGWRMLEYCSTTMEDGWGSGLGVGGAC